MESHCNKKPLPGQQELEYSTIKEATTGFEPVNSGFADRCLTTWLRRHNRQRQANARRMVVESGRRDSNS